MWERDATRLLVVEATQSDGLLERLQDIHRLAERSLQVHGAILFRGFSRSSVDAFHDFAASFGHRLLPYEFGSTPRSRIGAGVYSSTEYPADQSIPQHNEQSYTCAWPMKIWFYCETPPSERGATPISDSRALYRRIDPAIRRRFAKAGLMYVRNYGNGLDLAWQQVFRTTDRAAVEAFCRSRRIAWEWLDNERLRTWQICQSEASHPVTGAPVWFNQAHLFHVSSLAAETRDALLATVDESDLPRHVYYGDGTPIEDAILDEIRSHYDALTLSCRWQKGDVLMLDNMLTAHGRAPFRGARRILVAMAEPWPPPSG
jgi:alpha-ketoglutarate-dependent taurine dioxygenase